VNTQVCEHKKEEQFRTERRKKKSINGCVDCPKPTQQHHLGPMRFRTNDTAALKRKQRGNGNIVQITESGEREIACKAKADGSSLPHKKWQPEQTAGQSHLQERERVTQNGKRRKTKTATHSSLQRHRDSWGTGRPDAFIHTHTIRKSRSGVTMESKKSLQPQQQKVEEEGPKETEQ